MMKMTKPTISPLKMFVCNYGAHITRMDIDPQRLIEILQPSGDVKAINCNFGHKAQEGFEIYLKEEKTLPDPARGGPTPPNRRQRKKQGDGSCFNNCIESVIISEPLSDRTKMKKRSRILEKAYYLKYFPITGQIQLPGVIQPNLADGHKIVCQWIAFLNDTEEVEESISLFSEGPILLNFKFNIIDLPSHGILDFDAITEILKTASDDSPYIVREVRNKDFLKLSAKFVVSINDKTRKVRGVIFPRGKVNILGAADFDSAKRIYIYISKIIKQNWELTPLPDPNCRPFVIAEHVKRVIEMNKV